MVNYTICTHPPPSQYYPRSLACILFVFKRLIIVYRLYNLSTVAWPGEPPIVYTTSDDLRMAICLTVSLRYLFMQYIYKFIIQLHGVMNGLGFEGKRTTRETLHFTCQRGGKPEGPWQQAPSRTVNSTFLYHGKLASCTAKQKRSYITLIRERERGSEPL